MTDDLEELAKKGRAAGHTKHEKQRRQAGIEDDYRRYLTERLVAKTFSQVHPHRWIVPIFVAALLAAVAACSFLLESEQITTAYIALFAIGIVGGFVLAKMAERAAIGAGSRWVANLPFAFESAKYLEALAKERSKSTMTLRISFERSPDANEKKMFSDACAGAVDVADRDWSGDTLRLRTPEFDTYFPARGDNESYFTNAQLHLWLRTLVDKALRSIHTRAPIARVRVKVE